jgi:RNA polymerase sigma-70 factor (ECF subfamily)
MSVVVQPAAGWVRVRAAIDGVPAGEQCRLYVVARDGSREQAGSWVSAGATVLDGAALIAPADVDSVQVETYAGLVLVVVDV